ncbi:S1 family peptidase [Micromonospora deserti]|uniref:S1 family peptidase n=1 Tax=Micromonospora deserti TaxID=2070366 RepID=UPI0011B3A7CD|nr:S1 family peptidase [Micromonospora deserti]
MKVRLLGAAVAGILGTGLLATPSQAAAGMLPAEGGVASPAGRAERIEMTAPPGLSEAERQDLETLAQRTGEPLGAILKRQAHSESMNRALARLDQVAPGIIAAAELWEDGTYRVYVKRASPQQMDAARTGLAHLPVTIVGDRRYSNADLTKVLPSLSRLLDAASPEVYEVSYDAAKDHFVATASATAAKDIRGAYPTQRDGLVDVAGMPVELIVKNTPPDATPETTVVGGAGLNINDGGVFRPACTGGFTVRTTTAVGTLTAGHCPNFLYYGSERILSFAAECDPTSSTCDNGDMQWHATSSIAPRFRADNDEYRDVATVGFPVVGDIACHYGIGTGHKVCGAVRQVNTCLRLQEPEFVATRLCNAATMKTYISTHGDSGGPWFYGSTALGIHHGSYRYADEDQKVSAFTQTANLRYILPGVNIAYK